MRRIAFSFLVLALAIRAGWTQGMGNVNADSATLLIRLAWPNERPVQEPVQLELINAHGMPTQRMTTNDQGVAIFQNLKPGDYRVKVSRSENVLESMSDLITIQPNELHHNEWVHAMPKDPAKIAAAGPAISANDLKAPEKARKEKGKGDEALGKKDATKAIEHLQKAVELYPEYASAWNDIGVAKARMNDAAGAKEAWHKTIEADPKFAWPYCNLSRFLMAEKKPADAEQLLNQALTADSNNAEVRYLLLQAEYVQHKFQTAMEHLQKLHAAEHKRFADAHVYAAQMLLDANQDAAAMEEFRTYSKEDPNGPRVAAVKKAMAQVEAQASAK